ncbi:MAG: phosphatase PAP2 family protein [Bacteroides sp.]
MNILLATLLDSGILNQLVQLDTELFLFFNSLHTTYFDPFMKLYSSKLVWVPLYISLVYVLWRNLSGRQFFCGLVCVALVILFADQVSASLIRPYVARLRPANPDNPIAPLVHIVDGYRGGRFSFPSCHAANTVGLAVYVALLLRHRGLSFFLMGWALLTCYSRIYLGVHYPGDLLVGGVIGAAGAYLMYRLFILAMYFISEKPRLSRGNQSLFTHPLHGIYWPMVVGLLTIVGIACYSAWC